MKKKCSVLFSATLFLAVVVLCLFALPTKANAASASDLTFTANSNGQTYSVSGCNTIASGDLEIPATYKGKPVTRIGAHTFFNCSKLTSITIPDSVTTIEGYAFSDCTGLTSITIPDSVTIIGLGAFEDCSELTIVTIGNGVKSISNDAFYGCTGLTSITIPDSVTEIGEGAFGNCSGLTSITIPDSVESIGYGAFFSCTKLKDVFVTDPCAWCKINFANNGANPMILADNLHFIDSTGKELTEILLDNSVAAIPAYGFRGAAKVTSISIPDSVTKIGGWAFENCTGLTSITIPDSVIEIKTNTFYGCSGLTSISIPDSVTKIGNFAFSGCSGLTSVTIPDSITAIGANAFYGCSGLKDVFVTDPCAWCKINFADSYANPMIYYAVNLCFIDSTGNELTEILLDNSVTAIPASGFRKATKVTSITIPDSVTEIGSDAFSGCTGLTSITIPDSVTSIGSYAFSGCSNLINIVIPKGITAIPNYAFSNFIGLTSITIPDGVTKIGEYAFSGCTGLTSITISDSITRISRNAFDYCISLEDVFVTNPSAWCKITFANKDANPMTYYADNLRFIDSTGKELTEILLDSSVTAIPANCFRKATKVTNITIPDSVTEIGSDAFYGCSGLTSITIPDSVKSIGDRVFSLCTRLSNVTIGNGVESIGEEAFYGCSGLTSVTIPDSIKSINNYAFYNCTELTTVTIGNSIESICYRAFAECTKLTDVYFNGTEAQWNAISIGSDNTYLTNATIHFLADADSPDADYTYTVKNGEVTITGYTGSDTAITIPSCIDGYSVTKIGDFAFKNCSTLTSVTIGNGVTSIGDYAFYGCDGLKDVYVTASPSAWWNITFGDIFANPMNYADNLHFIDGNGNEITEIVLDSSVTRIPSRAFKNCKQLTKITIPDSVTSIVYYAFEGCSSLTSVTIGNGVTSIGDCAFSGCSGLTSVIIPDSVTSIGSYAFSGCSGLTSVTIGNGVTSIGNSAFYDCDGLTSITIGNSVESIDNYAFYTCYGLKDVYVTASPSAWCNITFGDTYANPMNYADNLHFIDGDGNELTEIVLDSSVTSIPAHAFKNCKQITKITIPDSVTSIGDKAFYGCSKLKDVYYTGSQNSWENLSIGSQNAPLTSATKHYMHVHDYTVIAPHVVAPTCTEKGYTKYTCVFGEEYIADYVPALGHTIGSDATVTAPTCTEDGYILSTCSVCGEQWNSKNADALGHDYTGPVKVGLAPTCEEDGWEGVKCTRCDVFRKDTVIPATGHTIVVTEDSAPSCEEDGTSGGTHCSICKKVFVKPTPVPALGHDMGAWVTTQEATCTATGTKRRDCSRCDYFETDEIPVIDHSYEAVVTEPICTEQGYTTYTCKCGDTYKDDFVDALGHDMGQWVTTQEATCTATGTKRRDCSRCDYFETDEIPVIDHSYEAVVTEPTCTEQGYTTHTCKCGDFYTDSFVAIQDHDYEAVVTEPTCTEQGYTTYTCSCGDTYKGDYKAATGLAAPTVTVTNSATTGKPIVMWQAVPEADSYIVYRASSKSGTYYKAKEVTATSYTDNKATISKTYYYKVVAVYKSNTALNSSASAIVSTVTKCGRPTITVTLNSDNQPVISWAKVSGARKYEIYYSTTPDGTFKRLDATKSTSYTHTGATAGQQYYYKVRAYDTAETRSAYSFVGNITVKLAKPSITVKKSNRQATITWKAISGAETYELQCSINGGQWQTIAVTEELRFVHSNLAKGSQYAYRLCAMSSVSDATSAFSSTKSIIIKCSSPKNITVSKNEKGQAVLTWDASEGAKKYQIFVATSRYGTYKKVQTTSKLTFTYTKGEPGTNYYFKILAYSGTTDSKSAYSSVVKFYG